MLDPVEHDAKEDVVPGIVGMHRHARGVRQPLGAAHGGEQIDAGIALERLGLGQALGFGPGIADMAIPAQLVDAGKRE